MKAGFVCIINGTKLRLDPIIRILAHILFLMIIKEYYTDQNAFSKHLCSTKYTWLFSKDALQTRLLA